MSNLSKYRNISEPAHFTSLRIPVNDRYIKNVSNNNHMNGALTTDCMRRKKKEKENKKRTYLYTEKIQPAIPDFHRQHCFPKMNSNRTRTTTTVAGVFLSSCRDVQFDPVKFGRADRRSERDQKRTHRCTWRRDDAILSQRTNLLRDTISPRDGRNQTEVRRRSVSRSAALLLLLLVPGNSCSSLPCCTAGKHVATITQSHCGLTTSRKMHLSTREPTRRLLSRNRGDPGGWSRNISTLIYQRGREITRATTRAHAGDEWRSLEISR